MSLVNDALRRAKEAQRQAPPPPSPQMQFRPVEPAQHPRNQLGLIVPAALAVVALLVLLFIWELAHRRTATGPREAQVPPPPAKQPSIVPKPSTPPAPEVIAAAAQPRAASQPSLQSSSDTNIAKPLAVSAPTIPSSPPVAKENEYDINKSVAVAPPPAPKWPPLKLQAIVFDPKRPSVLINGATLFVGEKLGELRVVAIGRESATLVCAGSTNILSMPQ